MLSNLEQHFSVDTLHHGIDVSSSDDDDDDDVSTESDLQDDGDENQLDNQPETPWTAEEDELLRSLVDNMDPKNWIVIAESLPGRSNRQCKRRWAQLQRSADGKARTPWTKEEDDQLKELVALHGSKAWKLISSLMPGRKSKQCRERWTNVVDPKLNYAPWTEEEEQTLILAQQELGNKWSQIEKRLPGRSANSIKNYWYSALRRGERKRAKMERKAMQPEGKKRRPRKPKATGDSIDGETNGNSVELPLVASSGDVISQGETETAAVEGDNSKRKGGKRKKKDSFEEANIVNVVPDTENTSDGQHENPTKKTKKSRSATETAITEENGDPEMVTDKSNKQKSRKSKENKAVDEPTLPSSISVPEPAGLPALPVESELFEMVKDEKGLKRKISPKSAEEETLPKPVGKKRRKNIAIIDDVLSSEK